MKNITEIESGKELIRLACQHRLEGDNEPYINPQQVTLVIDGAVPRLQDEKGLFQLAPSVTDEEIYQAMAKKCNIVLCRT